MPSLSSLTHSAFNSPWPNVTMVPTFIRLAGFTKHSQTSSPKSFNKRISITAWVSVFSPKRRAGNTLVSFSTKVSPFSK